LKKDRKKIKKIENRVESLNDNVFNLIKSMEEDSVEATKFYILFLDYLENMVDAIEDITEASYDHVNNNHKNLKFNQIRDLKALGREMNLLLEDTIEIFDAHSFQNMNKIIREKSYLLDDVYELIQKKIKRNRTTKSSRKNNKVNIGVVGNKKTKK